MGLLEKLWDDTVAGPRPDSGLGRLRKFSTFSFRSSSGKDADGGSGRSMGEEAMAAMDNQEKMKVTRSITIVRPPGNNQTAGSAPVSPAGDTPPPSPFSDPGVDSGGDRRQMHMKRRRTGRSRSPPSPYDV